MNLWIQATLWSVIGLLSFGLLLFLPAGTLGYWQGWLFMAIFTIESIAYGTYLGVKHPDVLRRRMAGGPTGETRPFQRALISVLFVSWFGMMILAGLDNRFVWSPVPAVVSVIGNAVVALGLGIAMLVVLQNAYAAANVTVEAGQKLTSGGLYGLVRHPMYVGTLIMMVGIPLALNSVWAFVFVIPVAIVIVLRILDEEKLLERDLDGYAQYEHQVHYRLVPHVW